MPHRSLLVLLVAAIATLNVAAQGQTPAPPPLTYERVITSTWKNLHDRILEMAKDTVFPDDKLGWKPHPDSRSVLDEFRQVTMGLEFSTAQLRGEKLDGPGVRARRDADAGKPKTRASMVCAQLSDEPLCPPPAPSQVEGIQLCGRRHRFASLLLPWS